VKTTLYTLLCVAIRLGAVLMAVNALEQVPTAYFRVADGGHVATFPLLFLGATLLLAFALWIRPGLLAWWALNGKRQELLEAPIRPDQLQYVALSVMGAWMAIGGLAGCIGHLATILIVFRRAAYGGYSDVLSTSEWHWLVQYAVTAVAGAALMLGSRGVVGLLQRLRGYPHIVKAVDADDARHTRDG
jgi:hypothetical protein